MATTDTEAEAGQSANSAWLGSERSTKISENLAKAILKDIKQRQLQPGTKLPAEAVMLKQYGVGRASLREALRILEVHGLIKIKPGPGGGPVVNQITSRDFAQTTTLFFEALDATVEDLLRARMQLEPLMARMAAENLTDGDSERLEAALAQEREGLENRDQWSPATADFHSVIASLTGNRVLELIGKAFIDVHAQRVRRVFPPEDRSEVLRTHERIGAAILDGNGDEAERLTRRHLASIMRVMKSEYPRVLEETIEWF